MLLSRINYQYHLLIVILLTCISDTYGSHQNDFDSHVITKRNLKSPKTGTDGPYLPKDVTPVGYHVWIEPLPFFGFFVGQVEVNISCLSPTNNVILHAGKNLDIRKAEISVIKPQETFGHNRRINSVSVQSVRRSSPEDWCEVSLSDTLQQGVFYQLTLEFTSPLSNKSSDTGIYYGKYNDGRWFTAADMRGNNARKVFPCFDEFTYKTPFSISIGRRKTMRSLSNMALQKSEEMMGRAGWMYDHFETSPPMSPFSVNFFVFDPEVIVPVSPRDDLGFTTLHMYGPTSVHEDLQDAGTKIIKTVEKIETYLHTKYPLPDLQIVVAPGIESHHEGFGLIIFREEPRDTGLWSLDFVFNMADQWLVHLTTPHNWTETLIGNSVSRYVSIVGFLETFRGYKDAELFNWETLYTMAVISASNISNCNSSFENPVGVWLLRMLNFTMSENTLRSGLTSFLYDRSNKTFVLDDFLAALSEQARRDLALPSGVTVRDIVKSWLDVKNCPVITVLRNYTSRTAHVEQQLCMSNKSAILPERVKNHRWYLPLTLLRSDQPQDGVTTWMKGERTVELENMPPPDVFILINPENTGLFVVNYDPTNWALITKHLTGVLPSLLSPMTRSKLLTDAYILAYLGELSFSVPLEISLMLRNESDYGPWLSFDQFIWKLRCMLQKTKLITSFHEYVYKIISDMYEQLGGYSETPELLLGTTVKGIVQRQMCHLGAEDCIEANSAKFVLGERTCGRRRIGRYHYSGLFSGHSDRDRLGSRCVSNPRSGRRGRSGRERLGRCRGCHLGPAYETNHGAARTIRSCLVIKWGSYDNWTDALLWALGHNKKKRLDPSYLAHIVSCTEHKERINELLEAVLLKYTVSDEDMLDTIDSIGDGHPYELFNYVSDKWFEIKKKYENKQEVFKSLVNKSTSKFTTSDGYDLVSRFYSDHKQDTPSVLPVVAEAMETIVKNREWYDRSLPQIESWLQQFLKED